jgi:hypothetical protein
VNESEDQKETESETWEPESPDEKADEIPPPAAPGVAFRICDKQGGV